MTERKQQLQSVLDKHPEGYVTKNKYRAIRRLLCNRYPELEDIPPSRLVDIVYDAVNSDRDWRKLTENRNKIEKKRLADQWVKNNL